MSAPGSPDADDLVGDLIAEVARTHGIAISRDDPVIAVVLLNQLVLRRYLEDAVAPASAAIREATQEAVAEIEQLAKAQAIWMEQVSFKDRASFIEEQKALHEARKADMAALIDRQNGALREVVMQAAATLRAQGQTNPSVSRLPPPDHVTLPPQSATSCRWILAGMLLSTGSLLALTCVAAFWVATRFSSTA